jgi:hypothetical protein
MARGWESKSVEEQRSNLEQRSNSADDGPPTLSQDDRLRAAAQQSAARERQKQSLHMQRELILSQRTSSPVRRAALEDALKQIEAQIEAIG